MKYNSDLLYTQKKCTLLKSLTNQFMLWVYIVLIVFSFCELSYASSIQQSNPIIWSLAAQEYNKGSNHKRSSQLDIKEKDKFLIKQYPDKLIIAVKSDQFLKVESQHSLIFEISTDSGVFQPLALSKLNHQYHYHNISGNWIWIKLTGEDIGLLRVYFGNEVNRQARNYLYDLTPDMADSKLSKLSDSKDKIRFIELKAEQEYSIQLPGKGLLLIEHQIVFDDAITDYNHLYQFSWSLNDDLWKSNDYISRPEVRRLYENQCHQQLGLKRSTLIDLQQSTKIKIKASVATHFKIYYLSDEQSLFQKNQKIPIVIHQQQKTQQDLAFIINNYNLFMALGVHHQAQNDFTFHTISSEDWGLLRRKNSLQRPLYPIIKGAKGNIFHAYYSRTNQPQSIDKHDYYLNEALIESLSNNFSLATFYPLSADRNASSVYQIPMDLFNNKLKIALANFSPNSAHQLIFEFDTGQKISISTEVAFADYIKPTHFSDIVLTALNTDKQKLPSTSEKFSSLKQAAPYIKTLTGSLDIPPGAQSFKIYQQSKDKLWMAMTYSANRYSKDIKNLETVQIGFKDFLEEFQAYKDLKKTSSSYLILKKNISNLSPTKQNGLNKRADIYNEMYQAELLLLSEDFENTHIESDLKKYVSFDMQLKNQGSYSIRINTLLKAILYSQQESIHNYALKQYRLIMQSEGRFHQLARVMLVSLIKYRNPNLLNDIVQNYQSINAHNKALIFAGLSVQPQVEYLLSSAFEQRQWWLFERTINRSQYKESWLELKRQWFSLQKYGGLFKEFTPQIIQFINNLGQVWVQDNRWLMDFKEADYIRSNLSTVNQHVIKLSETKDATLIIQGPLKLRIKTARVFKKLPYDTSKNKLIIANSNNFYNYYYQSTPAKLWNGNKGDIVGTFDDVHLQVPAGIHKYTLSTTDHQAYVYFQSPKNLLAIQTHKQPLVDSDFIHLESFDRAASKYKNKQGYIKSGCQDLQKLNLEPTEYYRPVNIDLEKRDQYLSSLVNEQQNADFDPLKNCEISQVSKSNAKFCISHLFKKMLDKDLDAALKILRITDKFKHIANIYRYRYEVFKHFSWRRLKQIKQSDGWLEIESESWQADSIQNSIIQQLNQNIALTNQYLNASRVQGIQLNNNQATSLSIGFYRLRNNQTSSKKVTIHYQINQQKAQNFSLERDYLFKLDLDGRENVLRFWLDSENSKEYISMQMDDQSLINHQEKITNTRKQYFVATKHRPLKLELMAPARLKIVSLINSQREIAEQSIDVGDEQLSFYSPIANESYYRFFVLRPKFKPASNHVSFFNSYLQQLEDVRSDFSQKTAPSMVNFTADSETYIDQDYTLEAGLVYGDGVDFEEIPDEVFDNNRLTSFYLNYYSFDPITQGYWSQENQYRNADDYKAWNSSLRLDWLPYHSPWRVKSKIGAWFAQSDLGDVNSIQASSAVEYGFALATHHRVSSKLNLFYRSSLSDISEDRLNLVHSDIWSAYKENHKYGVSLSQSWSYKPYIDAQVYASAKLQSNTKFFSADYFQSKLAYRQLYENLSVDLAYRGRRYFTDSDRDHKIDKNYLEVASQFFIGLNTKSSLKITANYSYEVQSKSNNFNLGISWIFHRGNYLNSYRPAKHLFDELIQSNLIDDNTLFLEKVPDE